MQRVQQVSEVTAVAAWTLRETGEPYVAAAAFSGDPPVTPDASDFRSLARLPAVARLDGSSDLIAIGRRHRFSVAVPIPSEIGEAVAVLLLGPEIPGPRILAGSSEKPIGCRLPLRPLSRWHGSSEPIAAPTS